LVASAKKTVLHSRLAVVTTKAAGPVALLLPTAVADFTEAVEEYGAGQRVARMAFVPYCQGGRYRALLERGDVLWILSLEKWPGGKWASGSNETARSVRYPHHCHMP
jgi:hypothetical protein